MSNVILNSMNVYKHLANEKKAKISKRDLIELRVKSDFFPFSSRIFTKVAEHKRNG